ncbi:MAG: PQQ-like beta-propeller repeat protein [Desulfomonile tiedjei]|uniref:PQQ-like beta-propeller repeat protein n=1 Tax=Desulfomonile tiedjei TaxID=2358 RepID=A0A9D6V5M4_9BACT|nr:PQQ-like beta-propeller repeat protein [Desulfomonile tiedjei]
MNYPDYYLKACNILRCKPESSFEAKKTRFHRMAEHWQLECYHCMGDEGQQPQLSEGRLEELQWAVAVIHESECSLEPRPQPSTWVDRLWQDLPIGRLIPEFSLGEAFAPWVEPIFANGLMYTGYSDFSIGAVDIAAKEGIWSFPANGGVTSPVMDEGVLVFGSTDKHAYALDASTGQEIRRFKAGAQIRFSPAVRDGSVCISAGRTQIHCLEILSGRRKWSVRTDTPIIGRPFRYDDSVFQFDKRRRLYCYDANTGEFRWTANAPRLDAHHLIQVGGILAMPQRPWWFSHPSFFRRQGKGRLPGFRF